jgi:hypothetical protein
MDPGFDFLDFEFMEYGYDPHTLTRQLHPDPSPTGEDPNERL